MIIIIVASIAIGIFWRYVLRNPLPWPNELSMFLLLWVTFFGASLTLKDDGHYKINLVENLLSDKVLRISDILNDLLKLIFLIIFIFTTIRVFPRQSLRQMTVYLNISKAWHTFSLTVGFGFMALFVLEELLIKINKTKKKDSK